MLNSIIVTMVGVGCMALAGCASAKHPPAETPVQAKQPAPLRLWLTPIQENAVDEAMVETRDAGLNLDDAILQACPAVSPPRLDFDSSKLKKSFRGTMTGLADCMLSGGLKGKKVLLVGHADPRGEEDYNMSLGGRRAWSVRAALESLGVEERRVDLTSRGALEAIGTDETGWRMDRRVDITLKM